VIGYILRWFTHSQMVTHPGTNLVANESNSQPLDYKITVAVVLQSSYSTCMCFDMFVTDNSVQ